MTVGPGTRLGPYEIASLLGRGGMGEVYKGRDTRLQRDVAIKTLPPGMADNPTRRARFQREAQTISQLSHPNICAIYDIGEQDGVAFLVMEYIEGQSLAQRLRLGPILWTTALSWAIEIASAIDAAHRRGIVHRDLKPANIMIGDSGIKLLDFGIAKLLEESDVARSATTTTLTSEHQLVGTVNYMSPEQLEGRDVDQRTDIFAFGATLYEMLTGRRAFDGASAASVSAAVLASEPPPMASASNETFVPPGLDHVVRRAIAKDPGSRWQTARDLMIELQAIQARGTREVSSETSEQPASRAPVRPTRWSRRRLAAGVAIAALLAAGSWYLTRHRSMTLAVVPLEAASGTPATDSLEDGITEAIIDKLGQAAPDRLRVIAHSSVRRYKGQKLDAASAGREMGAGMILTLRMTPQPDAVSIRLELVRANDGTAVWGHTYDSSLSLLFATEDTIATKTLEQLHINVTDEEKQRLTKRYTENLDAYRLYLAGASLVDKQADTEINYEKGLESFQKAIDLDANYALAYAGKARAYLGMGFEGFLPPGDALKLAMEAAAKANDLDASTFQGVPVDDNIEEFQWHIDRAIELAGHAVRANRDDPLLYKNYARHLRAAGRWPEAIAAVENALRLDPLGVQSNADLGTTYSWKGDLPRAIEQYKKTIALEPKSAPLHELLADVYARLGRHEEAIAELREALTIISGGEQIAAALGADFATSGYDRAMRNYYQWQLDALTTESRAGEYVSPMDFVQVYCGLRDANKAFEFLGKAFDERHPWLAYLRYHPTFEPLRTDPRFLQLVNDVKIPEASQFWSHVRVFLARLGWSS